jgi:uncharacterized lipoprotein YehR (DUF1307 family)
MKKIKFLLMLLLGVVMSVSFVSCGDDDDDDKDSGLYAGSPIVGSWTWTWSEDKSDRGSMTYTFYANGTFTWTDEDSKGVEMEKGTFQYDKDSGTLILVTTDATNKENIGGREEINVKIVANCYIVIHETKFYKK